MLTTRCCSYCCLEAWKLGGLFQCVKGASLVALICIARGVEPIRKPKDLISKIDLELNGWQLCGPFVWFVGSHGGRKGFGTSMEKLGKNSIKPERHTSLMSQTLAIHIMKFIYLHCTQQNQPKWCRIIYHPWFGASSYSYLIPPPISIHRFGAQGRVQRGAHRMRQRCSCGIHGSRLGW